MQKYVKNISKREPAFQNFALHNYGVYKNWYSQINLLA